MNAFYSKNEPYPSILAKKIQRKLQVWMGWKKLNCIENLGNGGEAGIGEYQQQRKKNKFGMGVGDDSHV